MDHHARQDQLVRTAVVLGAYGLIGSACVRALKAQGFEVVGVGRCACAGLASDQEIRWITTDIARTSAEQWKHMIAGAPVVVNAAGALQASDRDDLVGIHENTFSQLIETLSDTSVRFIQISAAGAADTADTEFLRSKARGDGLLMSTDLDWIILRPTLVFGPQAYGGTALLRASAAMAPVGVMVFPESPIQTIHVNDLAQAVVQVAQGDIKSKTIADLTEEKSRTLREITEMMRCWQGFKRWRFTITPATRLVRCVGYCADALRYLGWRSPLCTTALRVLQAGVVGNPTPWITAGGRPFRSFDQTLRSFPASTQERWFARLYLFLPIAIVTLAIFWSASGFIGLASRHEAMSLLTTHGLSPLFASIAVVGGSLADILLGASILKRSWAKRACLGMVLKTS